jgi:hypothetical protein
MRIQDLISKLSLLDQDAEVLAHYEDEQEFEVLFIAEMDGPFVSLQLKPIPSGPPRS